MKTFMYICTCIQTYNMYVMLMGQDFQSVLYGTTLASQKADIDCEARISQALCLTVSVDELLDAVQQTSFTVADGFLRCNTCIGL